MNKQKMNKSENKNIHSGHRERMFDKMSRNGLTSFADHEILEVILYKTIARANTNTIAHDLLATFGSLKGVLTASKEKLMLIKGVGKETACYITLVGELFRRSVKSKNAHLKLDTPANIKNFVRELFAFESEEKLIMICADKNLKVTQVITLSSGDSASTSFSLNEALKFALMADAKFVIFAHNHLDSETKPSAEDISSTKMLVQKFAFNKIAVFDHIITNGESEFSFRDMDFFYDWFKEIKIDLNEILKENNIKNLKMNCSSDVEKKMIELMLYNKI